MATHSAALFVPSIVVWVIFHVLIFHKRSIDKVLASLGFVLLAGSAAGLAPMLDVQNIAARQAPARDLALQSQANVQRLTMQMQKDLEALNLVADNLAGLQSREHVSAWIGRLRQAETLFTQYNSDIAAEHARVQQAITQLDIEQPARERYLNDIEAAIGANSLASRITAVRARNMGKIAEMLSVLDQNPSQWTLENNHVVFTDETLLARYNTIVTQVREIEAERIQLEQQLSAANSAEQDHGGEP